MTLQAPCGAANPASLCGPRSSRIEQRTDLAPRALVNDHGVGGRERLQAGRKVRRLADRGLLPRIALADGGANHDKAGRNANSDAQVFAMQRRLSDRRDHGERGPHRNLGVRLVRFRPTEINQHAIADVARNEPAEAGDCRPDARLIGADHRTQIFWVKPGRQRGGARDVAEHDAELPALRNVGPGRFRLLGMLSTCRRRRGAQRRDSIQQPPAVANRADTEVLQVVCRQAGQEVHADGILDERRRILRKTQFAQPSRNVHCRSPRAADLLDSCAGAGVAVQANSPQHYGGFGHRISSALAGGSVWACCAISESRCARCCLIVMAGLGPAIHDFAVGIKGKTWMAGLRRP